MIIFSTRRFGWLSGSMVVLLFITACQSNSVTKQSVKTIAKADTVRQHPVPLPWFKFSVYISGSGLNNKPFDSFTIDTNGVMGVHTTRRTALGKWDAVSGVAQLDAPDFDTLRLLVLRGKLYEIDSSDMTEQCAGDEEYNINIVPLIGRKPVRLVIAACAADYNLLLEPQRLYFRKLIDWFERMRVKYRPARPE
jgi:hypothetical protein